MKTAFTNLDDLLLLRNAAIAEKIVDLNYTLYPELWRFYGPEGKRLSLRGAEYHLPFLAESISAGDPAIYGETVRWLKKLLRGVNLPDTGIQSMLECTRSVLADYLDEKLMPAVCQCIDFGIREINSDMEEEPSYIAAGNPCYVLAGEYHESLVRGDRNTASNLIIKAVQNGVPVKDIYLHVFQVSQYEVGRIWLAGEISVAQEHFCSAATQMIMSQLFPFIISGERKEKTMIGASIGGELHEIGIRMVSDFFEMDGWNTCYLGANSPASAILKAAELHRASLIALSIAMPYHGNLLKQTIEEIRSYPAGKTVKIMVGGNAVIRRNGNYRYFGADEFAPDADAAVALANQLVN